MDKLVIIRGDTTVLSMTFTDENGDAFNLTGSTVFFTMKLLYDTADNDDNSVLKGEQSVHTNAAGGLTEISFTKEETRLIAVGDFKYDLQVVDSLGNVSSTRTGMAEVIDDTTKRVV